MADYNRTRYSEHILLKTDALPPSFTVHLHPEHWTLNNGSKFLYHNQIASLLDDIRAHRIPVDFLDLFEAARVPFYEGCMVVELLDYRTTQIADPPPVAPQKTRVVLHPTPEALWADLCSLSKQQGSKWTDMDALEAEAKILLATSQPLCLDPDPHLTRVVNHVIRVSTPTVPLSLKRKAAAMEPEQDSAEKARRERFLSFMAPRDNRSHAPSYRILDAIAANKAKQGNTSGPSPTTNQYANNSQPPTTTPTPAPSIPSAASPTDGSDKKSKSKKDTPQIPFNNVAFVKTNGSHTPIPPQPTHQFVNQHPPPVHPSTSGSHIQPQAYANLQAATEAAKRTPTPQQPPQPQQPHLPQQQFTQTPQHYTLQFQTHPQRPIQQQPTQQQPQPQHVQPPTQPQQVQPRPPSQPQQPQPQQNIQPQTSQFQIAQQRFTQSPKPARPPSAAQIHAQQPTPASAYPPTPSQFNSPLPGAQFALQPPSIRMKQPMNGNPQVGGHSMLPPNTTPQTMIYQQQMQHSQQQQQRMNMVAQQKSGGRATPQIQMQQGVATSPSPVRASPAVAHAQVAMGGNLSSPMPPPAQVTQRSPGGQQQSPPHQHAQQPPQQHTQPQPQQTPSSQQQQQHRGQFVQGYNQAQQLRTPHMGAASLAGQQGQGQGAQQQHGGAGPTFTVNVNGGPHTSPVMGMNGRPMTPAQAAAAAAGSPSMKQQGQQGLGVPGGMQMPNRRPTPLQQAQMQVIQQQQQQEQEHQQQQQQQNAATQAQAQAQAQAQTAQQQLQTQAQAHQPATPAQAPAQIQQGHYGYPVGYQQQFNVALGGGTNNGNPAANLNPGVNGVPASTGAHNLNPAVAAALWRPNGGANVNGGQTLTPQQALQMQQMQQMQMHMAVAAAQQQQQAHMGGQSQHMGVQQQQGQHHQMTPQQIQQLQIQMQMAAAAAATNGGQGGAGQMSQMGGMGMGMSTQQAYANIQAKIRAAQQQQVQHAQAVAAANAQMHAQNQGGQGGMGMGMGQMGMGLGVGQVGGKKLPQSGAGVGQKKAGPVGR